jgi:hypothetical protein
MRGLKSGSGTTAASGGAGVGAGVGVEGDVEGGVGVVDPSVAVAAGGTAVTGPAPEAETGEIGVGVPGGVAVTGPDSGSAFVEGAVTAEIGVRDSSRLRFRQYHTP